MRCVAGCTPPSSEDHEEIGENIETNSCSEMEKMKMKGPGIRRRNARHRTPREIVVRNNTNARRMVPNVSMQRGCKMSRGGSDEK